MGLNIFLFSLAIIQANRGNSAIWTSCVTDVDYSALPALSATPDARLADGSPVTPMSQYSQQYHVPSPPQNAPQQVYTSQPQQHGMPMVAQV
jgi:hypothetical protein